MLDVKIISLPAARYSWPVQDVGGVEWRGLGVGIIVPSACSEEGVLVDGGGVRARGLD